MRQTILRAILCFAGLCLVVSLALSALAKDGRDFAGFYAISNTHDSGDPQDQSLAADRTAAVELTLTVQIFNYSDLGDIKEPVVALLATGTHEELGKFISVKLRPSKRDVIVSGHFQVTREEFKSWNRRGGSPKVVVMYQGESGQTLRQNVQLSRRPILPPATTP